MGVGNVEEQFDVADGSRNGICVNLDIYWLPESCGADAAVFPLPHAARKTARRTITLTKINIRIDSLLLIKVK